MNWDVDRVVCSKVTAAGVFGFSRRLAALKKLAVPEGSAVQIPLNTFPRMYLLNTIQYNISEDDIY